MNLVVKASLRQIRLLVEDQQDYQQANMNAINAVMLRPEIPPALPEVTMAPATIFPEPMKLTQPDHLKRGDFGGNSSQVIPSLQVSLISLVVVVLKVLLICCEICLLNLLINYV